MLTRQAVYLINEEPNLVHDVEYSAVAQGLQVAGDLVLAEEYWKKSIDKASSDFIKTVELRGYAIFLFSLGKYEEGRTQYALAVKVTPSSTDEEKAKNSQTHITWMESEALNGFEEDAAKQYNRAKALIEKISSEPLRNLGLERLEQTHNRIKSIQRPLVGLEPGAFPSPPIDVIQGSTNSGSISG